MDRKDQIRAQVREAVELIPDMANAIKSFDPSGVISHVPYVAGLAGAALVGAIGRRKKQPKAPPPLGPRESQIREIPGILTTRQRS